MSDQPQLWRCSVCGYIHRQPEPPANCPVCGSPREAFEPYVQEAAPAQPKAAGFRCLNCRYVHRESSPPAQCPVCGSPTESFEPLADGAAGEAAEGNATKVVIVGAGVAGTAAAEAVRTASAAAEITLVSKEADLPYYRLNLTRYVAGEITEDDLPMYPEAWYEERSIQLLRETEVSGLALDEQSVELRSGDKLPYEKLILTVGAHPFVPPFPGAAREGVSTLRTVTDAKQILDAAASGAQCICIGGGLLGLETAGSLAKRGAGVTLLEGHGWLLPRQLTERGGKLLESNVAEVGIELKTMARTAEIVGDDRVRGVQLEDGTILPADLVVIATGVRPNSYLARLAGLEVNQGLVVDNHLVTSHPNVLAAGDVAEHRGTVYGIWGPSQYQGSIAGMNAVGIATEFGGIPRSNTLKVLGQEVFSIGQIQAEDASYTTIDEERDGNYFHFLFRDTHLVGAILLGDASATAAVKKAVETKQDFSDLMGQRPTAADVLDHLSSGKG